MPNLNDTLGVALTPATANQVSAENAAESIANAIMSGEVDPVMAGIMIKKMEKIVQLLIDSQKGHKGVREVIRDANLAAIGENKNIKLYGVKISRRRQASRLDYTNCTHPLYLKLTEIKKEIDMNLKALEDEFKALIKYNEANQNKINSDGEGGILVSKSTQPTCHITRMPDNIQWLEVDIEQSYTLPRKPSIEGVSYTID